MLNFDRNLLNLFGTGEKLPKIAEGIFLLILVKMWYLRTKNIKGVTVEVEILEKGQSDPALEKTTKQLFCQSPAS